ncbi:NAD(P)/FAD-dependent oxidoreductase [Streptomyces sp. NPDC015232]|uniref:NAD(P)/FAD-dependent oxidoreductase n=1 Tax=unclassified Streptomyces TaxID=2593676 RepID=UPI0036FDC4FC
MSEIVAVIGGGYGGASVAKALDEQTDAEVVLVEPKDAFEHAAGSLRALVRPDWAPNIHFRYDRLLRRGRVIRERATAVDAGAVTLASGARVEADHIVLATGSRYPRPAKSGLDSAEEALARLRATHAELAAAERVLIAGAGPVGLELAGEIKAVWPGKRVVLVDPAPELLPGFAPELRADLLAQLAALDVELRLGTALAEEPPVGTGLARTFAVRTTDGTELTADLWFRAYGGRVESDFLTGGLAKARTPDGRVRVDEHLRVAGQDRVYAVGDITDLAEAKMAGYAMQHAQVVAENIAAALRGEEPAATYRPSPVPSVLLPLGPTGGVGQVPSEDGPQLLPAETVAAYKGADLFTGRFVELFGTEPVPAGA